MLLPRAGLLRLFRMRLETGWSVGAWPGAGLLSLLWSVPPLHVPMYCFLQCCPTELFKRIWLVHTGTAPNPTRGPWPRRYLAQVTSGTFSILFSSPLSIPRFFTLVHFVSTSGSPSFVDLTQFLYLPTGTLHYNLWFHVLDHGWEGSSPHQDSGGTFCLLSGTFLSSSVLRSIGQPTVQNGKPRPR